MSAIPQSLQLREIRPGDNLTGLSLSDTSLVPLKSFLRNNALEPVQNLLRRRERKAKTTI